LEQSVATSTNNGAGSNGEDTPIGLPLNAAMEVVSSSAASSGNTVSSDDEGMDEGAMDEETAPVTSAAPFNEDLLQDTSGLDRAVEAIVRQVSAPETGINGAVHSPANKASLLSAGPLTTFVASSTDATIKKEPTGHDAEASHNGHAVHHENVPAHSPQAQSRTVKEETEPSAHFSRGEDIRTIEDLHRTVVYEMNRRKVSQSKAAIEANLRELGMGQPALSKFLSVATINNNDRGKQFSEYMIM